MATAQRDNNLRITSSIKEINGFEFRCSTEFTVSQFLTLIDYKIHGNYCLSDETCELNIFDFILENGKRIKACPDIYLYDFLNNFNVDYQQIHIEFNACYQTGATGWVDYIKFSIYSREKHNEPHVHISRTNSQNIYRMSLTTYTQMKGDRYKISKDFNRKERKRIVKILKENSPKLTIYYNLMKKGEYIDECYQIYEDGTEVSLIK